MAHWLTVSEFHLQEHRTVKEEGGKNPSSKNLNKETSKDTGRKDRQRG